MNIGGIAKIVSQVINNTNLELEHVLITGKCAENEVDYLISNMVNCKVIYVETLGRRIGLFSDVKTLWKITCLIKSLKPNIVHTHAAKAGFIGRIGTKIAGTKSRVIHTYHGHLISGYFNPLMNFIVIKIEQFLAKFTDEFIAVSSSVRNELVAKNIGSRNRWHVINPGIYISNSLKLEFTKNEIIDLLWIGRFESIKNPDLAIKTYELLCNYAKNFFKLTMVGDGKLLQVSKQYATSKNLDIEFTGWVENPFSKKCDVLMVTSKNEGFGLVILEAASRGIPTIVTDISGVKDFVENNVTGWIVDKTPSSFVQTLLAIQANQNNIYMIGNAAKSKMESGFQLENMIEKYKQLYFDALI